MFVVADQGVGTLDQVPRKRAATKGVDFIPGQMTPPSADQLPSGATVAVAGQKCEADVCHFL